MKNAYKNLFIIVLICGIITLIVGEILIFEMIFVTGQLSSEALQEAQKLTASEEVSDMAGYGALFNYMGSGFTKIIQIMFLFFSVGLFIAVIVYLTLYYVAGRMLKKGEDKNKVTTNIILVAVAVFMKMYFIYYLSRILYGICISNSETLISLESILFIILYFSEIISVVFTIIFYIKNLNKIKEIYNERIEKSNEN